MIRFVYYTGFVSVLDYSFTSEILCTMFFTLVRRSRYFLSRRFTTQIEKNTCINFLQDLQIEALTGLDQGIVVLGLNRSKGKNSLSKSFAQHLSEAFDRIYVDKNCRVVVLRSCIRDIFCPGADLKERLSLSEIEVPQLVSSLRSLMLKVENTPVPVIAAVDGVALGGGLELALACDLRVISESSKVGLVETKLAIMPGAGGTQRLPRLIGPSLAKELIFTSRILDGLSAKEYGLVNHCVKDNDSKDAAFLKSLEIAREILPNGPLGVKMAKIAINKGLEVDIHNGCSFEELCYAQVIPSKDRIEGLMAFREKRSPKYKGE